MPSPKTTTLHKYKIKGLTEDKVFREIVAGFINDAPKCAKENFTYAFTEILNNAIEHSGGDEIEIHLAKDDFLMAFLIEDDGVGIFSKVAEALALDEKRQAILELLKGKFTTAPERHTGEGIFFSSKCGDLFAFESDEVQFATVSDIEIPQELLMKKNNAGTRVLFQIEMAHRQTLKELFDQYTDVPESYGFSKTAIPVRLLEYGAKAPVFVSRSQARRLLERVERFSVVSLDFSGVDNIGQGFADEVFRVFKTTHPDINLIPMNCSETVYSMIQHVLKYR